MSRHGCAVFPQLVDSYCESSRFVHCFRGLPPGRGSLTDPGSVQKCYPVRLVTHLPLGRRGVWVFSARREMRRFLPHDAIVKNFCVSTPIRRERLVKGASRKPIALRLSRGAQQVQDHPDFGIASSISTSLSVGKQQKQHWVGNKQTNRQQTNNKQTTTKQQTTNSRHTGVWTISAGL